MYRDKTCHEAWRNFLLNRVHCAGLCCADSDVRDPKIPWGQISMLSRIQLHEKVSVRE